MRAAVQQHLYLLPLTRFPKTGWINITDGRNCLTDYEVWDLGLLSELISWLSRGKAS